MYHLSASAASFFFFLSLSTYISYNKGALTLNFLLVTITLVDTCRLNNCVIEPQFLESTLFMLPFNAPSSKCAPGAERLRKWKRWIIHGWRNLLWWSRGTRDRWHTTTLWPCYQKLSPFSTRRDNKGKRVALHFLKKHIIGSCQFGSFWRQSLYGFQPPHRAYWRALLSLFFHIRRSHWAWHAFWIDRRKGAVIICGTLETLRLRTLTMESTST